MSKAQEAGFDDKVEPEKHSPTRRKGEVIEGIFKVGHADTKVLARFQLHPAEGIPSAQAHRAGDGEAAIAPPGIHNQPQPAIFL